MIRQTTLFLILALLLGACADDTHFKVSLTIDDIGTRGVTMMYYADGTVYRVEAQPTKKGVLTFEGVAKEPTLADFALTSNGQPVCMLVVQGGEHVKVHLNLDGPAAMTVKGSRVNEQIAAFLADHAEALKAHDTEAVNEAIHDYVLANTSSLSATALLVSRFEVEGYEAVADSLLNVIAPECRPVNLIENFSAVMRSRSQRDFSALIRPLNLVGLHDSIYSFNPADHSYTLIAFTTKTAGRNDSVGAALRQMRADYPERRLGVIEISMQADEQAWRSAATRDSARYDRTWVPGAAAATALNRLSINRTPYFIVADSAGRQLLRTPSASAAIALIGRIQKR